MAHSSKMCYGSILRRSPFNAFKNKSLHIYSSENMQGCQNPLTAAPTPQEIIARHWKYKKLDMIRRLFENGTLLKDKLLNFMLCKA